MHCQLTAVQYLNFQVFLFHSVEQTTSSGTHKSLADHKIPSVEAETLIYIFFNNWPLDTLQNQLTLLHTFAPRSYNISFIIILRFWLLSASSLLPLRFLTTNVHILLIAAMRITVTCPTHLIFIDLISLEILSKGYNL
jgi:hypothetical protein